METSQKVGVKQEGIFNLDKLAALPNFYMPTLNHAEDTLAFYWDQTGRLELYLMNIATREVDQLTDGELPRAIRAGFIWSRDDSQIIFTRDRDGDEMHNLYTIDITTKEVTQLTETPDSRDILIDSSPDGKWYIANSDRHGQMNLYRMENGNPDNFEQITMHENPANGGEYSPDGEWLLYSTNEEGDLKNSDIYLAKPDGFYAERLVQIEEGSKELFSDWGHDSSYFAFSTDRSGIFQAAIYDRNTEEFTYFGDNKREEYAAKITDDGKHLVCISQHNGSMFPVIYEIDSGKQLEFDFPEGIAAGSQVLDNSSLLLTINTPTSPSKLLKFDFITNESEILLDVLTEVEDTDLYLDNFVDGEHIWYESTDGTSIPAIVYKPRDWSADKLYPAVVNPHGGPTGNYFMNFSVTAQYLTDLGYVVLLPNVRGSTGYGVEFRDACLNGWGIKDHEDWVAGRQWLIDHVSVDPDRVVVFGGSYGGYATLVCMTKSPDLWAAGVAWIPVSHLKNMYDESDEIFQWFLRQQMGDPHENAELWEESSPLNYVENITAPLLLVHGVNDPRCPVNESRNVVRRMRELGRSEGADGDFQYVEFDDEGHGSWSDIQGRIRTLKVLSEYLYNKLE